MNHSSSPNSAPHLLPDLVGESGMLPDSQSVRLVLHTQHLFQHARQVDIVHEGRVYCLRLTQLNKLILTA